MIFPTWENCFPPMVLKLRQGREGKPSIKTDDIFFAHRLFRKEILGCNHLLICK